MTYYRIKQNISMPKGRIKAGEIAKVNLPEANIKALLLVGAIAPIYGPSLINVPEITDAQREALASIGIGKLEEFLNAPSANLQTLMGLTEGVIRELKNQLIGSYLVIQKQSNDCNC